MANLTITQVGEALLFGVYAAWKLNPPSPPQPVFKAMGSSWGRTWPIVYNNFRIAGDVIQAGPVSRHNHKSKKGGPSFSQTFAVGVCEGERQIGRIWADNKVIYDPRPITAPSSWAANTVYSAGDIVRPTAGGSKQFTATVNAESGVSEPAWNTTTDALTSDGSQVWIASPYVPRTFIGKSYNYTMRIYEGSETQLPDSALEELVGTGKQPAYRGLLYVVFENFDLTKNYGNRVPNFEFEVVAADVPEVWYPLLIDTGPSPTFSINNESNVVPDWTRNHIYSVYFNWQGIYAHNAATGAFISKKAISAICVISGNTQIQMPSIMLGADGFIYAVTSQGTNPTARLSKIDPSTMTEVSALTPHAVTFVGAPYFFFNGGDWRLSSFKLNGVNYLALLLNGTDPANIEFFNVDTMASVITYDYTTGGGADVHMVAGEQPTAHTQKLYLMEEGPNGNEDRVQFVAVTFNDMPSVSDVVLSTLLGSDISPSWVGINVDVDPLDLMFCSVDNSLIFFVLDDSAALPPPDAKLVKINTAAGAVQWTVDITTSIFSLRGNFGQAAALSDLSQNTLIFCDPNSPRYFTINLADGTSTVTTNSHFDGTGADNGVRWPAIWDSVRNTLIYYYEGSNQLSTAFPTQGWVVWKPGRGQLLTLADICADVSGGTGKSGRIGLLSSDYDYSALTPVVPRGAALLERGTARSFLESLQPAFFYDLTDIGAQIIGSLRSGSSILLSIPEEDLAVGVDPSIIVDRISTTRGNDLEIPKDLSISYYDVDHDYQQGSQQAKRNATTQYSSGRNTIGVPVVMKPGEASTAAMRGLYLLWIERAPKKLMVPIEYLKLTPADVIEAVRGGRGHFLRITKAILDPATLIISIEGVSEDLGVYSLTAPPSLSDLTTGSFQGGTITPVVPPVLDVLDTAPLRTSELVNPGVYVAGCASDPAGAWDGETVQESPDNSVYTTKATLVLEATIGIAQTTLGNWPRWTVWDDTNSIDVTMTNGTLNNASRDDLLNTFANLAWFSTGEIIQFTTATLLSSNPDVYRLAGGLLRARFGTDAFLRSHVIGESFVLLTEETMQNVDYSASDIGAVRYWQGLNDAPDDTGTSGVKTLTMTTRRLLPFAPYFIKGTRDGGQNLTITGLRRMRWRGAPLWKPQETDLPVTVQIDVLSATSPPTVLRTLTATLSGAGSGITDASAFTAYYAAADQVTDFGSTQASVEIQAFELNATIGRGYGRIATI